MRLKQWGTNSEEYFNFQLYQGELAWVLARLKHPFIIFQYNFDFELFFFFPIEV